MMYKADAIAQMRAWYNAMNEMFRDVTADDPSQRAAGETGEYDGEELGIGA